MAKYIHNQTVASTTWTINHDGETEDISLDNIVDFGGDKVKALPLQITKTDLNNTVATFTTAQTGVATVNT